jgi:uncharacterized protein YqeY
LTAAENPAYAAEAALRSGLTAGLRQAMLARDAVAIAAIRSLVAAVDNAGAVPLEGLNATVVGRSGDVARRVLSADDLAAVLEGEAEERRAAIATYEMGGRGDAADRLRAELRVIDRYRALDGD